MKKSDSAFLVKTPMNHSTIKLNSNSNLNLNENEFFDNNNFFRTKIQRDFKSFSNRVFKKRKKSSKK